MHLVSLQRMYSVSKRNVNVLILSVRRNVAIESLPFCGGMNHIQGDDRFNGKGISHLRGRQNDFAVLHGRNPILAFISPSLDQNLHKRFVPAEVD